MFFVVFSLTSYAQLLQPKKFNVNAYKFFGSFKTELKPMCEGFEISVSKQYINIGDDFNLKVESATFDKNSNTTTFSITDPKGQIGGALLGLTSNGDNYLQVNFLDEDGNIRSAGIIFQYWNNVDDFFFWRSNRDSLPLKGN